MKLRIAYLYPAEMNIYGDRGNIITLVQRLKWRGIEVQLDQINLGNDYDFSQADIIFGGGGQDKGQELVACDLLGRCESILAAAQAGTPMLVVCGLYQLFGRRFITAEGTELAGIGLFGAETNAGHERLIGNIVVRSRFGRLVGFENHSGQTTLDGDQAALGTVEKGSGNNTRSGHEGAILHNVVGTYLHGPILPKNPALADFLITAALKKRGVGTELKPLDDTLEHQAAVWAELLDI